MDLECSLYKLGDEGSSETLMEKKIEALLAYAKACGLLEQEDVVYTRNMLLDLLQTVPTGEIEEVTMDCSDIEETNGAVLEKLLADILEEAIEKGIIEDGQTAKDLFDTKVMGLLLKRPSEIIKQFQEDYKENPVLATDRFYRFCKDADYIRRYRICKDKKWKAPTEYGTLDVTINLSKPEKDPKAIAAAKLMKQTGYPKCLLCRENEGFAGHLNHPARQNIRLIPVTLANEEWYMQYSPYVYYNEHCIVLNKNHTPMKISRDTFVRLLDFVTVFPHYFLGSNADLPIVGGSILTHDHFQGGHYTFAMEEAEIETEVTLKQFPDITAGIVAWPMSVLRLRAEKKESLVEAAATILEVFRDYSDTSVQIYAYTDEAGNLVEKDTEGAIPHNTITPIARRRGEAFELDLVFRNNLTTEEHPLGVYHPHAELHHIKKENIGLIEVMGLAVLPARLKEEMALLKEFLLAGRDVTENESIAKHADWVVELKEKYGTFEPETIENVIEEEIGIVYKKVLEHAGIFKRDEVGKSAFLRFLEIFA